jgi:hypothetical protein
MSDDLNPTPDQNKVLPVGIRQQPEKHDSENRPDHEESHHRVEAKAFLFIGLWVFADVLVVFGHVRMAVWIFGIALFIALGLFTYHAQRGWPKLGRCFWWFNVISVPILVVILFLCSRSPSSPNLPIHASLPIQEKPAGTWQPPELPPGWSNVTVSIGQIDLTLPRFIAEVSSEKSGTKVELKDAAPELVQGLEKNPDYSPRRRYLFYRIDATMTLFNETIHLPALPYVVSNRLFVCSETPFGDGRRRISMSDDLDAQLPRLWDRNYDSNKFEIVTESGNPVFQVIYEAADHVRVKGIFIVDTNTAFASFVRSGLITVELVPPNVNTDTNAVFVKVGTNSANDIIINSLYNANLADRKAIFRYPSFRYPGVLSKMVP